MRCNATAALPALAPLFVLQTVQCMPRRAGRHLVTRRQVASEPIDASHACLFMPQWLQPMPTMRGSLYALTCTIFLEPWNRARAIEQPCNGAAVQ